LGRSFARDRLLGIALLISLVLHGTGALLMPELARVNAPVSIETVSFTKVKRVEITHKSAPMSHRSSPVRIVKRFKPTAEPKAPIRLAKNAIATPPPDAAVAAAPAQTVARDVAVASPHPPIPTPRATASVDARDVATQTVRQVAGGFMPFGADNPPVLDPDARKQLVAMNVHVTIKVTVTDDGHTKSVSFDPPLGKALETQIQTLLAAANWDPAYCGGGIPCESQTTIKL